jgi:DNA polymerase-3 subunit epsilon
MSHYILPFDTETTGLPDWKSPSGAEHQPHIVQLAAILADPATRKDIATLDVIIKPDGWDIPQETIDIHGITTERAMDEGIPEAEALDQFIELYRQCSLRVAHSTTFDNRLIRIALKRYRPDLIRDDEWKDKAKYFCTLMNARKIMGGKDGHTLGECYHYFFGKPLEGAHNAMVDTRACMEIYWAMQDCPF